jgi:hypothetical protein
MEAMDAPKTKLSNNFFIRLIFYDLTKGSEFHSLLGYSVGSYQRHVVKNTYGTII